MKNQIVKQRKPAATNVKAGFSMYLHRNYFNVNVPFVSVKLML